MAESGVPSRDLVQKACEYAAKQFRTGGGVFVQDVYDSVNVVKVYDDSEGIRTIEFLTPTPARFDNGLEMVHGGASSTLCSVFSTLALSADSKLWSGSEPTEAELANFVDRIGVTRSVDVQILQAVPLNSEVYVRCQLISRTKSNAFITAAIYSKNGRLLVRANHDMIQKGYEPKDANDPQHFRAQFHLAKL